MVLEKDFDIKLYSEIIHWIKIERIKKSKINGTINIAFTFSIDLDDTQCITFNKNEIDFLNKAVNNKHFPTDFKIVIKAKILRYKILNYNTD